MRGLAKATLVAIAIVAGAITSAPAQQTVLNGRVPRRNFDIPPSGEARFVDNEPARAHVASDAIGTQSFSLTGRTISRWHIDGGRSVADTLRLIRRDFPGLTAGQANKLYVGAQTELAVRPDAVPDGAAAQYVVRKLHLLEAHRINKGDDVLVAVIHSQKRSHCQNEPQANRGPQVFSGCAPGLRSWRLRRTAPIRSLPALRLLLPMPAAWRRYCWP
jgi:hypothetical protein